MVQGERSQHLLMGAESLLVRAQIRIRRLLTCVRDVGLFRYWTLPNLPLFVLAAPMLWLLLQSSVTALRSCNQPPLRGRLVTPSRVTMKARNISLALQDVPELALPQLVLAVTAITSFHVQIVNRIASGYPTWYLMVAAWFVEDNSLSGNTTPRRRSQWILRGMTLYVLVQGMLFANFLPPA